METFGLIRFNEAVDQLIYEAVGSFYAEKDLQARQFDTILSSMSDHSYILDLDGKFIYANKPMLQSLNVTFDELVGKSHFDLNFSTAHEIHTSVNQVTQLAERRSGEVEYCFPSGEVRHYEYIYSPVFDGEEGVLAVAAIERDVTDRKQVTEALEKSEEECQRKVEERTRELQEKQSQYLHAEKLSAIGKLSASIAHEFNNPLQGVMTILKGLKKISVLEEEDVKLLDLAISESQRMKNLIRNLQDFNKPSPEKKVMMDVHASIDSLLLLCKSDFRRKKISVVLNYSEQSPQILAIPDQIKQVFLNLLNNAADACQKSNGVITISTCYDQERVAVTITDNGIGIKPEKIDLIFEPFYTFKAGVEGTGLGLSVCRGIVQAHNGEIRVESQPGKGSSFTVLLPIGEE
jgi:PAS domain S-box-containing protein